MNIKVDVLVYGGSAGSGKSRLLLMKPLAYLDDPLFSGVFFRRTTKALDKAGSLWPEGKKLYKHFNPVRTNELSHLHVFPSGCTLTMDHLEHEKDAEGNHQGTQYSFIGFDELTHFEQSQFVYLLGRMRSESDSDSFCVATCNPDPDSWVLNWVQWYLDSEGYPDPDKCGAIRYFVIADDEPIFGDSPEELKEKFPELCCIVDPFTGEEIDVPPMSFSFIGGTIFDNPALIRSNPRYLSALKAQGKVNRARLLDGNWYARPEGANYFQRGWLEQLDKIPLNVKWCRAWDKASEEPSDVNRYPDFTASVKVGKDDQGYYYIAGDYVDDNKDDTYQVYGKFRKRSGSRNQIILSQAQHDGEDCTIVFPLDPGAAGKDTFRANSSFFMSQGFPVRKDPMPNNKNKLTRFEPFSSAAEKGLIKIIPSSFRDKRTLDAFLKELESFDGDRSSSHRKDD